LRSFVRSEPAEVFVGFGRPILSPINGTVVSTLDGEPDHQGRRSQLTLVPYMLTQGRRVRAGPAGIAGNHVVVAISPAGPFALLAHLRRHSVQVSPGEFVVAGQQLAACGNSGNSTEPHLHVQVSDSTDWDEANGVPLTFQHRSGLTWIPHNTEIVDA
jgi:murein DD-endopeptidase MepM/ murein hydrolase activator NlpD